MILDIATVFGLDTRGTARSMASHAILLLCLALLGSVGADIPDASPEEYWEVAAAYSTGELSGGSGAHNFDVGRAARVRGLLAQMGEPESADGKVRPDPGEETGWSKPRAAIIFRRPMPPLCSTTERRRAQQRSSAAF